MPKICKKCEKEFPHHMKIEGKIRNLQRRKYCLDCSPFGSKNTKQLHLEDKFYDLPDDKYCPNCEEVKDITEFYIRKSRNREPSSYCKICNYQEVMQRQREFKAKCVAYGGGCCQSCGYDKCLSALIFHHINPSTKKFNISAYRGYSRFESTEVQEELDKCVLLCSNCHKEEHARINGWLDGDPEFL